MNDSAHPHGLAGGPYAPAFGAPQGGGGGGKNFFAENLV